ncbi:MAG TPA: hypothetical protein DCM05_05925 [Elusimicrobia bacterium]|nr:hypothetical protein [Elusimicrobiota bacterium]
MVPVNFNQLYYFWVIAKAGSITAATRILLLNQSTLSQQLKQLETALGKRLLLRSRHGAELTEEGRFAYEHCEKIFTQAEELLGGLRSGLPRRPAALRIGYSRAISGERVFRFSRFVERLDREVSARVVSGTPEELEERLRRRAVDIVLSDVDMAVGAGRDCRSRLVGSVPHFFVAAPALKLAADRFPQVLAEVPLLLRPPENAIRKEVERFLHRHGILPKVRAEVEDPNLILAMILDGAGVGILGTLIIQKHVERGRLIKLHARPIGIRQNLWLLASSHPNGSERVQALIDKLMSGYRLGL